MAKMVSVNKDALKYAREYYALTLEEVSEKTDIKSIILKQYEDGEDFPTYSQLEKLSNYYNKPMFYFFNNEIEKYPGIQVDFRSDKKIELTKRIKELMDNANIYKLNLEELYKDEKNVKFSELLEEHKCNNEKDLILFLHDKLCLDLDKQISFKRAEQLLEYLRDKFYEIGVYIFKDSFKDNSVSGLCVYDAVYPIILLNNKTTFTRQLFTLFHEVYHIYLHKADVDYVSDNKESACNNFASFFLIPQEDFKEQIKKFNNLQDKEVIQSLADRYCVSDDAIMYRLAKTGIINWEYYDKQNKNNFRENNAGGGNFYYTRMSYMGNAYLNKVFNSYYSGKITKAQVGMYTKLKPIHVSKLASRRFGGAF